MGMLRKLFFVLGIVLIALPLLSIFLSLDVLPQNPNIGFVSNDILSFAVGALLVIFSFLSWNRERKRRMLFGGPFRGPRGPGDAQLMPSMAQALEERRRREQEAIRRGYAMQMRAVDKRFGVA